MDKTTQILKQTQKRVFYLWLFNLLGPFLLLASLLFLSVYSHYVSDIPVVVKIILWLITITTAVVLTKKLLKRGPDLEHQSANAIDNYLNLKQQTLTIATLKTSEDNALSESFTKQQLLAALSNNPIVLKDIVPFYITKAYKYSILAALLPLGTLLFLLSSSKPTPEELALKLIAKEHAEALLELAKTSQALPERLKEEVVSLAESLEEDGILAEDSSQKIITVEQNLDDLNNQISPALPKENRQPPPQEQEANQQDSQPPTNQQTTTPKTEKEDEQAPQSEQQQQEKQQQKEQQQDQSQQKQKENEAAVGQGKPKNEGNQGKDQKSEPQPGESEQSAKKGDAQNKQQGQPSPNNDQQKSQGSKEKEEANASGAGGSKESPSGEKQSQQQKEAAQLKNELNKIKESQKQQQQQKQGGKQSDSTSSQGKEDQKTEGDKKQQQQNQQGAKSENRDGQKQDSKSEKQSTKPGEQQKQEGAQQKSNDGEVKPDRGTNKDTPQSNQDSNKAEAHKQSQAEKFEDHPDRLPKADQTAPRFAPEDGGKDNDPLLGPDKKLTKIELPNEGKLHQSKEGQEENKRYLNKGSTKARTELGNVEYQKPDVETMQQKQPIPVEYQELLK